MSREAIQIYPTIAVRVKLQGREWRVGYREVFKALRRCWRGIFSFDDSRNQCARRESTAEEVLGAFETETQRPLRELDSGFRRNDDDETFMSCQRTLASSEFKDYILDDPTGSRRPCGVYPAQAGAE